VNLIQQKQTLPKLIIATAISTLFTLVPSSARAQCGTNLSCSTAGTSYSVTNSGAGTAIVGANTSTTGPTVGVRGTENSSGTSGSAGVWGQDGGICSSISPSPSSAGVRGDSTGGIGVEGYSDAGIAGVAGSVFSSPFCPGVVAAYGYLGAHKGSNFYGVYSGGDFGGTGAKYFLEPHPTDASKEIRYVSLEGPEAGTYFRGTAHTVHGYATIEVPESFRMVTAEGGLTVVVTPVGELAQVACISKSLDKIVVQASKDVTFDYVVNGVRKAFKDFQAISENHDFVPLGPDDHRFATLPAESQRRLIATGIYTAEGKVNLEKAHEMGWDRAWAARELLSTGGFAPEPANR
jgi:hypothetical protein